jgi:type 1 glutamine amidotransferase
MARNEDRVRTKATDGDGVDAAPRARRARGGSASSHSTVVAIGAALAVGVVVVVAFMANRQSEEPRKRDASAPATAQPDTQARKSVRTAEAPAAAESARTHVEPEPAALTAQTEPAAGMDKPAAENMPAAKPDRIVKNEGKKKQILLMLPQEENANKVRAVVEKLGQESGLWTIVATYAGDPYLNPVELAKYDILLTYDCQPGPAVVYMSDSGGATLLNWISNGGALIAFHSGFLNRKNCKYVGGERMGHPWSYGVPFTNNAPNHPIMQGWPLEFQFNEEIFDWNLEVGIFHDYFHLLYSVDMSKASPKVSHGVPVAGCAEHGQGRIYFNHWGHNASTFEIQSVKDHVIKVIRWVTKMDGNSPTASNPEYSRFEDVKAFVAYCAQQAGKSQSSFASFYSLTAETHPDLAASHVETVAALRIGQGSITDYINSLENKVFESVSITAPLNGATYASPDHVTINANASGNVSKVEFYCQGGVKLGEDTSAPYSCAWNSVPGGSYTLTAKVTDDTGETTTSAGVDITVTSPLTVSITSPATGASFQTGANITITANPVDTAGTVTTVEFYQGSTKLGEATSAPWTYTWNSVVTSGAYSLTAVATDSSARRAMSTAISIAVVSPADIANGLVGWWKLDKASGTTAADSSATGANGTLQGGLDFSSSSVSGKAGTALKFTATDADYVRIDQNNAFSFVDADFSVSVWVKADEWSSCSTVVDFESGGWNGWLLRANGGTFNLGGSGGERQVLASLPTVGEWQHVVVTYDEKGASSQIKGYLNGVLSMTVDENLNLTATTTAHGIGANQEGLSQDFVGVIDDVRVYNRALSAEIVNALYLGADGGGGGRPAQGK